MIRKPFLLSKNPSQSRSSRSDFSTNETTNNSNDVVLDIRDDVGGETTTTSDFDVSLIPINEINKRTLHPYSIHYSNSGWTATLSRPDCSNQHNGHNMKYLHYSFPTETEARKFCKAYSPPKYHKVHIDENGKCMVCATNRIKIPSLSQHNCRNCGVIMCEVCTRRWGIRMIPRTYHYSNGQSNTKHTVRVCKSCDWLSNSFCMSLLQGRYNDAVTLFDTGNVNLRTAFADIHKEAMFPIHCAVLGGNVDLVKWLVEVQMCPISAVIQGEGTNGKIMKSLQTSESRTLLDLAMTGRKPKLDILMFLIQKGLSIDDVKDTTLASKTLQIILKTGKIASRNLIQIPTTSVNNNNNNNMLILMLNEDKNIDNNNSSIHNQTNAVVMDDTDNNIHNVCSYPIDESAIIIEENFCTLCCEKPMDCVLVPCGHQLCCSTCGTHLGKCPICNVNCTVLRIYRQ